MQIHHLVTGSPTLLLTGLKQLISGWEGARVSQLALPEQEVLGLIQSDPPDFFWTESRGQGEDTLLFYRQLLTACPELKIIVFCAHKDPKIIRRFLRTGIAAYLLPDCSTVYVEEAMAKVAEGSVYIDPSLHRYFTDYMLDIGQKKRIDCCSLTRREREVLRLIVEEHTTQEIANKLYINFCTVETHRLHLIQKMGVKNTAGLVREALVRQLYASP